MTDSSSRYDVIVIGAGHNGLICASYLAKAGRKVLILESLDQAGGCAATREFSAGFSVSACAQWLYQLSPDISSDLHLERHGLAYAARELNTIALAADGRSHLKRNGTQLSGPGLTDDDARNFSNLNSQLLRFVKVLDNAFKQRPPKLVDSDWQDKLSLTKLGLDMKRLGKEDMNELLRVGLINIYDLLNEHLDNELLKGALSLDAVLGTHMGPRSPNTVFTYLYRLLGEHYGYSGPALLSGGMGTLGSALGKAAQSLGVDIRTNSAVTQIDTEGERCCGVTLDSGETLTAPVVASNADPKSTFRKLLGYRKLEAGFARRIELNRAKGNVAKLHLALDDVPAFTGLPDNEHGARLLISPTMKYVERAFNHCKYGEMSTEPVMDISIPSLHDPSLAPDGKHVLSALVSYMPSHLQGGWNDRARAKAEQLALNTLAKYAPDIHDKVLASEFLSPADIEAHFGNYGGHWHHGEISLDQIMMMRPVPGCTQYATPVSGLYLCGAGTHPGGGLLGLPGRNAAQEILRQSK